MNHVVLRAMRRNPAVTLYQETPVGIGNWVNLSLAISRCDRDPDCRGFNHKLQITNRKFACAGAAML
jgi:hypothetical protein